MEPFVGQQPVGNLRWKAPVDVAPDDGVYEAHNFAKLSVQDKSISDHQGEDCLYLNVWKAEGAAEKRPVMVLDEFDIHPAKEADVKIIDWDRAWFLTKYYLLHRDFIDNGIATFPVKISSYYDVINPPADADSESGMSEIWLSLAQE